MNLRENIAQSEEVVEAERYKIRRNNMSHSDTVQ
jgi:hypothetical protein